MDWAGSGVASQDLPEPPDQVRTPHRHVHLLGDSRQVGAVSLDAEALSQVGGDLLGVRQRAGRCATEERYHRALVNHVSGHRLVVVLVGRHSVHNAP